MLCLSMAAWVELAALLLGASVPSVVWVDEDPAVTKLLAVALVRLAESSWPLPQPASRARIAAARIVWREGMRVVMVCLRLLAWGNDLHAATIARVDDPATNGVVGYLISGFSERFLGGDYNVKKVFVTGRYTDSCLSMTSCTDPMVRNHGLHVPDY